MINIQNERLLPLREVPDLEIIPRRRAGSRLDVTTVFRWALHGQRGVKLETVKIGGQRCTSINALQRFFDSLSAPSEATKLRKPENLQGIARSKATTKARLDQLGIK